MSAVSEKAIIRMRGVSRRFQHGFAVKDLDLEVLAGETVALIGQSGSGKTTTLRMINRLIERTSGSIEVMGEDVSRSDPAELRRRIGYVIQDVGLFPHYSVRKNIGVVPELLGWNATRIEARTKELMQLVGLPFMDFAERFPSQLSGGQRQRVGVARALAADPALILLDEPFGALDPLTREILQDEFLALCARVKKTFVLVTHDIFEAVRLANRIVVMHEGRVLQDSAPVELVQHPGHELVLAMLGRHRYQLELMTMNLETALRSAEIPAPDHANVVELPKEASVWDALTRLSRQRASTVRVLTDGQPRYASRERLLEAVK